MVSESYQFEPLFGSRIREAGETVRDFFASIRATPIRADSTADVDPSKLPIHSIEVTHEQSPIRTTTSAIPVPA